MVRKTLQEIAAALPLIAFRGIASGMPILLGLFIAHRWGLEELAAFTVANAAISIALLVVDWGALRALPRNLATLQAEGAARMLGSVNAFRLLLVAIVFAAGAVVIAMGFVHREAGVYLAILFPLCPLFLITGNAVSERVVAGETRTIGVAVAAAVTLFAILGGLVLVTNHGPHWFVAAYVCSKAVESLIVVAGRWWVLAVQRTEMFSVASVFWPFAAQAVLGVIYTRLAIFSVERMLPRTELGLFSYAVALQGGLLLVPVSLALIYFPDLTRRMAAGDTSGVRGIVLRYTIISCVGILLGLGVLAAAIGPLTAMFHLPAGGGLFVLAFASVSILNIFSTKAGFLVQAGGQEKRAARLSVVTVALAVVYQITALSLLGLWGIIVANIAAELTTIALFGTALRTRPSE